MSYASIADVETELGRPAASADESAQWQAWLDRVERAIVRGFRRAGLDLSEAIALGDPEVADVVDIEVARVAHKADPSRRYTSVTRSVDDASVTYRNESGGVSDDDPLVLSAADWAALLPSSTTAAFSTRPGFEPDSAPWDRWL